MREDLANVCLFACVSALWITCVSRTAGFVDPLTDGFLSVFVLLVAVGPSGEAGSVRAGVAGMVLVVMVTACLQLLC